MTFPSLSILFLNTTHYKIINKRKPNVKFFHVFGSRCFLLNSRERHSKFDDQADEGIFLGYSLTSKAYRVLNKRSRKIEETYYVTFDELYQSRSQAPNETTAEIFLEGNTLTTPLLNLYEEFLNLFDEPETALSYESGAKDNLEDELRKIIDEAVIASESQAELTIRKPIPATPSETIPIPHAQPQTKPIHQSRGRIFLHFM